MIPENEAAKAKAIEMARAGKPDKIDDVGPWFDTLTGFLAFHPDTPMDDYVEVIEVRGKGRKTAAATFTPNEAEDLQLALDRAFALCDEAGRDIYELCIESSQRTGAIENSPSLEDWKHEVANDDTKLGYEEWLEHKLEAAR